MDGRCHARARKTERIDARFLEPACGSGNFISRILQRKLAAVELKHGRSDFERHHYALLGPMCIYGIERLADNVAEWTCCAPSISRAVVRSYHTPVIDPSRMRCTASSITCSGTRNHSLGLTGFPKRSSIVRSS